MPEPTLAPAPADTHPLDNPGWSSLTGAHAWIAERHGNAARYPTDVSPFTAISDATDPQSWEDLRTLVGPGVGVAVASDTPIPSGWEVEMRGAGVQLIDGGVETAPDPEAVVLTAADVPEMLDLVGRTQPGPFLPRTIELGTYLGIRRDGALVAMAGERLRPPGWTEISAVCTDDAHRGQGFASRLVRAVAHGIRSRGDTPMLHAAASNTSAIRVYDALGFVVRREVVFNLVRTPES